MNWWQSLLIALIPSLITAAITLTISFLQNKKTKTELLKKYQLEQKNHISQTRFDTEFAIYKEISEKLVTLASRCVSTIFPLGIYYEPSDVQARMDYRKSVYQKIDEDLTEANITINKYAIFVPQKWYNQFIDIKNLCRQQINFYLELEIKNFGKLEGPDELKIRNECYTRTQIINDKFDNIVKELREYITKLEIKEDA